MFFDLKLVEYILILPGWKFCFFTGGRSLSDDRRFSLFLAPTMQPEQFMSRVTHFELAAFKAGYLYILRIKTCYARCEEMIAFYSGFISMR